MVRFDMKLTDSKIELVNISKNPKVLKIKLDISN